MAQFQVFARKIRGSTGQSSGTGTSRGFTLWWIDHTVNDVIPAMVLPRFTIVMPSLNQARFLEAALDSVLHQDVRELELLVADGGSTDGTLDILRQRAAADPRLRWFSEPDDGPAQALNRAFARVRGTLVGWLNSDDLYTPGAIARAQAVFDADPHCLLVYGQGQHVDAVGSPLDIYPTLPPDTPFERFAEGCFICQPTMFFRRTVLVLLGRLDENLRCSFDFEYWLRAFRGFPGRIGFIDALQACSRLHEDCITLKQRRRVALEGMQVLHRHLGRAPPEWLLTYVNELAALPAPARGVDDLRAHALAAVQEARQWLTEAEYAGLLGRLKDYPFPDEGVVAHG